MHYTWICKMCGAQLDSRRKLVKHHKEDHPNQRYVWNRGLTKSDDVRVMRIAEQNRISCRGKSHPISEQQKEQMREIALAGYRNGTWHGWMNCHSSKKSYPEEFFTRVIDNEFDDKNYEYNYLFYQYRLDFAWPAKKKCIEIDGSQHQRVLEQKESDMRKDAKLIENGWEVMRISWRDFYKDTKKYISDANAFIGKCSETT